MLFYGVTLGQALSATWQFGLYFDGPGKELPDASMAWTAFNTILFVYTGPPATGYLTLMRPEANHLSMAVYGVDADTDRRNSRMDAPGLGPGVGGGQNLPTFVAPYLFIRPDDPTASGRGRLYLPPCNSTLMTDGALRADRQFDISTWARAAWTSLQTAGFTPVIRSRTRHRSVPASVPLVSNVFASVESRQQLVTVSYM